jgi:hypothetical protein
VAVANPQGFSRTIFKMLTLTTIPGVAVNVGILRSKFVTALAVGLVSISFAGFSAPDIFSAGNRLQMFRIHAEADSAQMVNMQTMRDRSNLQLVGSPMGGNYPFPFAVLPVSICVDATCPKQASSLCYGDRLSGQQFRSQKHVNMLLLTETLNNSQEVL